MTLSGNKTALRYVSFDPSTGLLVAAGGGGILDKNKQRELLAWELPQGKISWQHLERSNDLVGPFELRPGGKEWSCRNDKIDFRDLRGKLLRSFRADFLCGPVAFSTDGKWFVAPAENVLKICDCESGKELWAIEIGKEEDSAKAAAFLPDVARVLVGVQYINSKGQVSGKLLTVDLESKKILKSVKVDFAPEQIIVEPRGRWAVMAGERRNRGWIVFWDLAKGKVYAEQGAHKRSIDRLVLSPDGAQVASTGEDQELRIWDFVTGKTLHQLASHKTVGNCSPDLAWSADGQWIALAIGGHPPLSGIVAYRQTSEVWQLVHDVCDKPNPRLKSPKGELVSSGRGQVLPITRTAGSDAQRAQKWFRKWLQENRTGKPLATLDAIAAWEKKNQLKLPKLYVELATKMGRRTFSHLKGDEGHEVRIVGPNQIDAKEYRRNPPEVGDDYEPDGVLFAIANSGDCLCFDVQAGNGKYAVYHFDHETEQFELFAGDFAQAVKRLVERR